ncbi:alanine--tRNA ligase [Gallaecimonas xiamenensis]|uniref:Alanine--tRNA ligase n=1 Tax=Gallaecimonas xiamenensis 3-C-1 TaxID=745411 RepID=K2JMK5_9GAMM|nr:alanine--tRNA ligase [Gallaecimonas xiamenensis]EKE71679.1 alanyl-tRNA ligase [Gallaecimonas xiamenensis 3-C-1]
MSMTSAEIRDAFLNYFKDKGHQIVPSSSLIPGNDPTLLFTNAGMVQFKDVFLGSDKRAYTRATSSQRCVRAGGKHNDLENVGYTARHHTFFEMLGNFSFGDYFKEGAIQYAWEFLTQVVKLPAEKLWVTVYETDDEAYDIWAKEVGVPTDRIIRIGDNKGAPYASDNFWSMGDTGPCGPCTEIFYDHGEHIWGGPPGSPEEDGDRYIEIWNIVFMQFNRHGDGRMEPLPKPSVDTGMGLERISAILQHVHSNYEIDIFQHLIKAAAKAIGSEDLENKSLRVVADHIRSCSFLVVDGVMPSNEGRGYVLRRIVRRAVRHGAQLGASEPFFYKLVAALIDVMGDAYPELKEKQAIIEKALLMEEEQFRKTLERGLKLLDEALADIQGSVIPGDVVFKLYDTYGFPVDLTNDVARERGLTLDEAGFETAMEAQRQRAKQASNFGADYNSRLDIDCQTQFSGYDGVRDVSPVVALFKGGDAVDSVQAGDEVLVVLERTPFYGESGGQVGDTGELSSDGARILIHNTTKSGDAFVHHGKVAEGSIKLGDKLKAEVDKTRRDAIRLNHSATHLAHAALRKVLGEHVTQKGSLVDSERMRFDFSHFEGVKGVEISEIERLVNNEIRANHAVTTRLMQIEEAKAAGAMALFGEKYDDEVRVVQMGDFSIELCGGTHVSRTGDIGLFKVISEGGIAAGVRRIEAVTGEAALEWLQGREQLLGELAGSLKTDVAGLADRFAQQLDKTKQLEKELEKAKAQLAASAGSALAEQAEDLGGTKLLVAELPGADPKSLRELVDKLKDKLGEAVVVLAVPADGKVSLIAGVSKGLTAKVKAGELVGMVAAQVGGKGGGRPDMAQAGGTDVAALSGALATVKDWVQARL